MADDLSNGRALRREIQETLAPRMVSEPLKSKMDRELSLRDAALRQKQVPQPETAYEIIVEINLNNATGRGGARDAICHFLQVILGADATKSLQRNRKGSTHPYIFATLTALQINELVSRDGAAASQSDSRTPKANDLAEISSAFQPPSSTLLQSAVPALPPASSSRTSSRRRERAIFRIWESQKVHPLTTESLRTVKANAAHNSFVAFGEEIVWAVLDSGVDDSHAHFVLHRNLDLKAPLTGKSDTFIGEGCPWNKDPFGHGTHVAGIIAGEAKPDPVPQAAIRAAEEGGFEQFHLQEVKDIKGMAPRAKLLILRVLDDNGDGDETALIQAIEYIQQLNDYGRHLVVHGVNISAGFPAHPTWYACGQTPLCVEINRLVKSGVIVVVAAGNSGHILTALNAADYVEAGQMLSINDPGNAALAITVGSTHRQSPHTYGISYFSSKGPTSDGRRKPEVVAPGEKIISCASSQRAVNATLPGLNGAHFDYIEDTGTSMAAPHVSGILAAFLSTKREFIGQPEQTKSLLMQSAMDLGRDPDFQGAGLVDLMKLIQSV